MPYSEAQALFKRERTTVDKFIRIMVLFDQLIKRQTVEKLLHACLKSFPINHYFLLHEKTEDIVRLFLNFSVKLFASTHFLFRAKQHNGTDHCII